MRERGEKIRGGKKESRNTHERPNMRERPRQRSHLLAQIVCVFKRESVRVCAYVCVCVSV